ncbi:histidine kinase [Chryseobacterium indologenes]|uniref:Regulator of cell autolysis n=1 Tax=Chryseobacterium indologenes TaxID=253 RepID=A0A0N0ZV29_CHRID|nr:histidine kinase [Chryseobacterium indologenes]KPE50908.1 regulator of cell autolysis [Chryseobacterium indologenes]
MKHIFRIIYLGAAALLVSGCNKKQNAVKQENALLKQINTLENAPVNPKNADSMVAVWRKYDKNPLVAKDTTLSAIVKYQMARLYGMRGQDSARYYVEQALELIEPTSGNLQYKTLIYNGIGNIRSMEAKQREAGYYYNKAAAIVSDTAVHLSDEARSAILLSAAQSNLNAFQYNLAEKMNRAALPWTVSLPEGHVNKQRVLVQMIFTLSTLNKPADSIKPYLHKLETLHARNPDRYDISFLYDAKMKYFDSQDQRDSLLHYQLMKAKNDETHYNEKPLVVEINNLFVDYSDIAATYVVLKQAEKAREFLQKTEALKKRHPKLIYNYNEVLYLNSLAGLYQLQGKPNEAIEQMKQAAKLQKEVYETENTQAVAEMNALYQLQAKDRSIRTLNENIKINQLELEQNHLWLVISVLGSVLLGIVLLFLYYSFRQRRTRQEKEKLLLQQQLLRTQMEPHFIFNTLSAVQSFVRLDKKENAIKYLNRFSRLLRSSLELSRENLVPLNEEIETLENYLCLQQMRYENAFTYTIIQPDEQDLGAALLPPMLIQPYVENAILHGINLDSHTGNIEVCFKLDDDVLQVTVTDTGRSQAHQAETSHRSLSGTISRERMQLLGKKASVNISKNAGSGTVVTLLIPVVYP